jgi:putative transcriptional regulator
MIFREFRACKFNPKEYTRKAHTTCAGSVFLRKLTNIHAILQYILYIKEYIVYSSSMKNKTNIKMKMARTERDLSQQQLADRVNATRQTIGLIEKGKYNPSLKLCLKIARALDKTLDQLFWEEAENEENTL